MVEINIGWFLGSNGVIDCFVSSVSMETSAQVLSSVSLTFPGDALMILSGEG